MSEESRTSFIMKTFYFIKKKAFYEHLIDEYLTVFLSFAILS